MFGLFGKKKVKVNDLTPTYVSTIYEVVDEAFPEIASFINEEKEFQHAPNLTAQENEWFLYIVYAANLVNISNYFEKSEADILIQKFSSEIIKAMGKDADIVDGILYDYQIFINELFQQNKSLSKSMSLAIFHKYDLNKFQKEHFQKLNTPSPMVLKELTEITELFLWNWDDYLSKYKVVVL